MDEHCTKCNAELSEEVVAEYVMTQKYFTKTIIPMLCTDCFDVATGAKELQ